MTKRIVSGSSRSPSEVEPVTSQKRMVTVVRISRGRWLSARDAPQESQNRAPSRFTLPHEGHVVTADRLWFPACGGKVAIRAGAAGPIDDRARGPRRTKRGGSDGRGSFVCRKEPRRAGAHAGPGRSARRGRSDAPGERGLDGRGGPGAHRLLG